MSVKTGTRQYILLCNKGSLLYFFSNYTEHSPQLGKCIRIISCSRTAQWRGRAGKQGFFWLLTDRSGSVPNLELTEIDTAADLGIL